MFLAATIFFFRSEDTGIGERSGTAEFFPEEAIKLDFVLSHVFLLLINDKGGVAEGPEADGFIKPLKGLGVGNPDQDIPPVFSG
jgi:hypothetical protein